MRGVVSVMGSMSPMMEEKMVMANMMVTPADSKVWLCNIVWQSGSGCDDVSRRANHFRTISHHQRWNTETLTQWQLLPGVRGQGEAQHRHGGDQEARHDQVGEVVQRPPPDLDLESDVKIRLRTTVVYHGVLVGWNFCKEAGILSVRIENYFVLTHQLPFPVFYVSI